MKSLLALAFLAVALVLGTVASSAAVGGVPSFAASKRYAVPYTNGCGRCAKSVVIGDLNGDGRPDVVTVNNDDTNSVFITNPNGTFHARRDYIVGGDPAGAAIADLNGDGHTDVAVADAAGFVTVLRSRGDGTLGGKRDYAAGTGGAGPVSIAAADLDGDGSPDLVTANQGENTGVPSVSVLRNNGDGTFAAMRNYRISGGYPVSVALGDLNGDGKPDIVTGDGDANVSVLMNGGDGTFQPERVYDAQGALSVALGDLNGDGKLDVATASGGPSVAVGRVSVFLNRGDGTLGRSRVYAVLSESESRTPDPQSIAIADLNGDRRPDLVTADFEEHVSLLLNGGAGTFHLPIDLGVAKCGYVDESDRALAIGDLNGDGRPDLAVAGPGGLCVSLDKPGLCNVQDVRRLTAAGARTLLVRAHCRVGAIRYAHAISYKRGLVSAQRPGFGGVLRAGAKVDLVVSLGRKR
jgi:hypothetical protein